MESIRFFGTSAGVPRADRNVSALALKLENKSVCLVDCGDGTAYQLTRGKAKFSKIAAIFITHMHGDHIFGLLGVLSCLMDKVTVIGPVGIRAFVEGSLAALAGESKIRARGVAYIELEPDKSYPTIPLGEELQKKLGKVNVGAYPLSHRCSCFGYIFSELEDVMKLDSKRAMELGARGCELGRLARGEEVLPAVGGGCPLIRPQDVLMLARRKRRVAIFGDTNVGELRPETMEVVRGCDVLVNECTYLEDAKSSAEKYGHSTLDMVSAFVESVGVKKVYLNHLSAALDIEELTEKAKSLLGDKVDIANDLQEYKI